MVASTLLCHIVYCVLADLDTGPFLSVLVSGIPSNAYVHLLIPGGGWGVGVGVVRVGEWWGLGAGLVGGVVEFAVVCDIDCER